jgi:hypothetical protein
MGIRTGMSVAGLILALVVPLSECSGAAAKASSEQAAAALRAAEQAGEEVGGTKASGTLKSVLDRLLGIPQTEFSEQDAKLRQQAAERLQALLAAADRAALVALEHEIDGSAAGAQALLTLTAQELNNRLAPSVEKGPFRYELDALAADALKGAACDAILNTVFAKPASAGEPPYSLTDDFPEKATEELAKKFLVQTVAGVLRNGRTAAALLEWADWMNSVRQDAGQVADAISQDPQTYVQLAGRQPVQRATVVYARFCYQVPREV